MGNGVVCIGFVCILGAGLIFNENTLFPGVAALLPVLGVVLVLRVGAFQQDNKIIRVLGWEPLQEIGRVSYSWYLWHWPVIVFATAIYGDLLLSTRVALLVSSFLIAEASYRLLEKPIRYQGWLVRRPHRSLIMAACIALVGVVGAFAWRQLSIEWAQLPQQVQFTRVRQSIPAVYSTNCHADFYTVDVDIHKCTFGSSDPATYTIVLFGDSHAAQWFPALKEIVDKQGWRLISLTKSGCPTVAVPIFDGDVGRLYRECGAWRKKTIRKIVQVHPDLVVISSEATDPFSDRQWFAGTMKVLEPLSRASGQVAILRDTPRPGFNVPACLARKQWNPYLAPDSSCTMDTNLGRAKHVFQIRENAASHFDNTYTIDLTPYICSSAPCRLIRNGVVMYRDLHHLTVAFAEQLAGRLADQIKQHITINTAVNRRMR